MTVHSRPSAATGSGLHVRVDGIRWVLGLAWDIAPGHLAGIVVTALVKSLVPAALAWVAKSLVDAITAETASGSPDAGAIVPWLAIGLALAVLDSVSTGVRTYLSRRLADNLHLAVTTNILTHAEQLDVERFEDVDTQDSLQRARAMTGNRFVTLITQAFGAISSALQVVTLTAVLVVIQPWTLLVVAVFAPAFLVVRWRLARRLYALEYNRATRRRWTDYFVDLVTRHVSVAETRLLGLSPLLIRSCRSLLAEFRDQNRAMYRANLVTAFFFTALSVGAFYALLLGITLRALEGAATLGDVAVFFGASARLQTSLQAGVDSITGLLQGSLNVSALMEFFDQRPSTRAAADPVPADWAGSITLEDVDFSYPGSSEPVLQGLSLEIPAGQTVALVGENGSGKTTLAKLVAGLYTPDRGCIRLDGRDITEIDPASLHRQIAFIFQNFSRYEATAADNIAYGDWEHILGDRPRVEEIARAAGVHEMITTMPDGYDTLLGRSFGAYDLAGGQWQKLAVARAFARPARLLILDEPTAAHDARAEYELFVRARELAHGRTTLLISHRFSTLGMADRILVMHEGQIVEQGTHDQLMRLAGRYSELYGLHQRQMRAQAG